MIAMVMLVLDARETAQTKAGIWQIQDHNMGPVARAKTIYDTGSLLFTNMNL